MPVLALDLGIYTIKAISGKAGREPDVDRVVELFNPVGVAVPSDEAVQQKLSEQIEAILTDNKLPRSDVRLSLPETVVSTNIIELPVLTDAELASAIGWQAEQHIPIPPEELSLEYQVLYRPDNKKQTDEKMRVLLVGAHKSVVERYVNMFVNLGIEPKLLETHILSVLRAAQLGSQEPPTLVVQFGASSTQLAMTLNGSLQFVTSHMTGGQAMTQAIENQLNLTTQQAEEYKRTYGFNSDQFEGKVRQTLAPVVEVLVNEIKKALTFFNNDHPGEKGQRILLSGGPSLLPGLAQHLAQQLGVEVLMSAPFTQATGNIPEANHSIWTVCMGLLMREEI